MNTASSNHINMVRLRRMIKQKNLKIESLENELEEAKKPKKKAKKASKKVEKKES